MAPRTPKDSRRRSILAMTWCATGCGRASPRCSASMPPNSNRTIRRRKPLPVTVTRSVVLGCGSYLPSRILTNAELARKVDTSDEWIVQRTGIRERRIAAPGERTSDLALAAARAALKAGNVDPQSIDLIVLATSTPDNTFPATAVSVQAGLGITHGAAFDLQAVCSGFVFALAAAALACCLETGLARSCSMRWRRPAPAQIAGF